MEEKKYVKDGKVRTANAISIVVNNKRYSGINQTLATKLGFDSVDALLASCGWVVYAPESEEKTLENAINDKIAEINDYGTSDSVKCVFINGKKFWMDKTERVSLKNLLKIQQEQKQELATVWILGTPYTLVPVSRAIEMLDAIELYAYECYNVTQSHIAYVKESKNVSEAENFDVTADYPEILTFEL
ncbi:MAG: hypothetical protein IKR18_11525 [Bacteroidaceae bacterium]|nr:hypothetical protein [Bacteroidaceae bacterium]